MVRLWLGVLALISMGCTAARPESSPADSTEVQGADEPVTASVALWLADRDGGAILEVRAVDGAVEILADAEDLGVGLLDEPSSVTRGPDDALYVTTYSPSGVTRLSHGEATAFFSDSYLEEPVELVFRGPELFVLGNDTGNVVVADLDGRFLRELGYPEMRNAHDMAFGPDGLLYVATSYSVALEGGVQRWDVDAGELVGVFASELEVGRATGLAFDDHGALYVADSMRGTVALFDAGTGEHGGAIVEGLDQPVSLAVHGGVLFVADRAGVHRYAVDGAEPGGEVVTAEAIDRVRGVTLATAPSRR